MERFFLLKIYDKTRFKASDSLEPIFPSAANLTPDFRTTTGRTPYEWPP